jgi:hypothetical protein
MSMSYARENRTDEDIVVPIMIPFDFDNPVCPKNHHGCFAQRLYKTHFHCSCGFQAWKPFEPETVSDIERIMPNPETKVVKCRGCGKPMRLLWHSKSKLCRVCYGRVRSEKQKGVKRGKYKCQKQGAEGTVVAFSG